MAHDDRVHPSEVIPEAGVEAELEAAAEGRFVPPELVGERVEADNMTIDTVRVFHLQLGELLLDKAEVVRISEPFPEDLPEVVSGVPEFRVGLPELLEPPVIGNAI